MNYYSIIFLSEMVYMILELEASRIISPYFGSTQIVWTAVIGIILLSSSIGNYFGGKLADKKESEKILSPILGSIGIFILLLSIIDQSILILINTMVTDKRIGAVLAAFLLFLPVSILFGMLSPIILKKMISNIEKVGSSAGRIHAVQTLGGIVGTFLGGFYLIPEFGTTNILYLLAGFMLFLMLLINMNVRNVCFVIAAIAVMIVCCKNQTEKTVHDIDTKYGHVQIFDSFDEDGNHLRNMVVDGGYQSATYTEPDLIYRPVFDYIKKYDAMFVSEIPIDHVLMIGGAAYQYPKYFISQYPEKSMDVVEIDGKVTELAKKYFYLDTLLEEYGEERLSLITEDGRVYLNENKVKYDAILNDAFSGTTPPKTLTTLEAVQKIKDSLVPGGMYLSNIVSSIEGENSKFIKAEVHTLKQVFTNVSILPCSDAKSTEISNYMVVATDQNLEYDNTIVLEDLSSLILTDEYCPVDTLIPNM